MALDILHERGALPEQQLRAWDQVAGHPYDKRATPPYSKCRQILMNGIEMEAFFFKHALARHCDNPDLNLPLAWTRRIEDHQQATVNWLTPADQTVLETTINYEQLAVDLTANLAKHLTDQYAKQTFDYGLLEDFDHLFRYSHLLREFEHEEADALLGGNTEVKPGRPTVEEHRAPADDLRHHMFRQSQDPMDAVRVITLLAAEQQTRNFYASHGPQYPQDLVRRVYAEIKSIEEQHVTQYEALLDPTHTWLERWVLHEAVEAYCYWSCLETEPDPHLRSIWEQFLQFEIGHFHVAAGLLRRFEGKEPEQVIGSRPLEPPIVLEPNKEYVQHILDTQVDLRSVGMEYMMKDRLPQDWASFSYQRAVNAAGSPTETAATVGMAA